MSTNWSEWHDAYARPGSGLGDRLAAVSSQIERHLDATAPAPVRVVSACAAQSDVYAHAVPADLVLLCGIFGNISDADVRATVGAAPELCAPRAEVVWTRHRHGADLTPSIRGWFADSGFEEVAFIAPEGQHWSVGVHRLVAEPHPLEPGRHWFTFFR